MMRREAILIERIICARWAGMVSGVRRGAGKEACHGFSSWGCWCCWVSWVVLVGSGFDIILGVDGLLWFLVVTGLKDWDGIFWCLNDRECSICR